MYKLRDWMQNSSPEVVLIGSDFVHLRTFKGDPYEL